MLDLDFNQKFDLELDFDLADFDVIDTPSVPVIGDSQQRIVKPKINLKEISHATCYENAEEFARQISLAPDERTYAWVNGNFIFGDILPALITARGVNPKSIYIASLSLSAINIEALQAVLDEAKLERLVILLSGYFYSHEKYNLIPYLYNALGDDDRAIYAFNRDVAESIARDYGTIDTRVPPDRTKKARDHQWQAVRQARNTTEP